MRDNSLDMSSIEGYEPKANFTKAVDDLTVLVLRLVRSLRKHDPDSGLAQQAVDYLARNGLRCSPLRSPEPEV